MIHDDVTTKTMTVPIICSPWCSFWQTLGFITLILSAERLFIFSIGFEMEGIFCMNLSQFELFLKEMDTYSSNGYQLLLLQLYLINAVMLEGFNLEIIRKSLKNTNTLCYFFKMKKSKLVIATWKLPSSKVYRGLNNALGICVHEKHYQVLPT